MRVEEAYYWDNQGSYWRVSGGLDWVSLMSGAQDVVHCVAAGRILRHGPAVQQNHAL